ncbi:outer membrane beta-barrel protein [Apibacter raozihei]|uniref:outer membrane beta-barrel protein n=1 Tax=Apibacter TaxID=1778601 RepID=UPI000FE4436D|nr:MULTISPECIES: outer membrane beta-barrel protein [Apibacter]
MKKLNYYFAFLLLIKLSFVNSQEVKEESAFKPSGNVIARGFLDYSNNFKNESGFNITRAFLGYSYKILPGLEGVVILDGASGKNSSGKLEPYLRNAYLCWKDKQFNVHAGLTGLLQFSIQENYWTHRYVAKSFQDMNSMAPSVDLGFTAEYAITPKISVDFSLTNGEGYKKIKSDNNARYAAGISVKPLKNTLFRVYADYYNKSKDSLSTKDQSNVALFLGYQNPKFSAGAEYNHQFNRDFVNGKDFYGYSFYGSLKIAPKWRTFARYDWADSSNPSTSKSYWSKLDGQLLMFGFEFCPIKQIKLAPNFRNLNYARRDAEQYFFINAEFRL